MRRTLFTLLCVLAISAVFAQPVPRVMVAVEDGTGTWCTYCPGAAMGCDDLLSNGKYVAVIANHNGDSYANTFSNTRNTMWGINGFPTVTFDGISGTVGGNHTQSLYSTYLPKYNSGIAITSPVKMSMVVSHTALAYTAVITIEKVDAITSASNVLYFFVTQSHITQAWQGQTHLEHVNRLMSPDQNGTAIDFTSGDVQTVTLHFNMDAAWPLADCEFIAFLQNKDASQGYISSPVKKYKVYQCVKQGTIDLNVDFAPDTTEINQGESITFTNNTAGGYIGVPETYEWSFPGGTPSTSQDKDPVVIYSLGGTFDVQLIVNRGGQIDTASKPVLVHVIGVGVNEQSGNQIVVSPNPSHGTFKLTFNVDKSFVANINIINSMGTTVYTETNVSISNELSKTIRTYGLPSGEYFLSVQNGSSRLVRKIVIN